MTDPKNKINLRLPKYKKKKKGLSLKAYLHKGNEGLEGYGGLEYKTKKGYKFGLGIHGGEHHKTKMISLTLPLGSKRRQKYESGGEVQKGSYTKSQRKTKQGSYRLYKKYKEAISNGDMELANQIHQQGIEKYKENFAGRFHRIGKYGEEKRKIIKYG